MSFVLRSDADGVATLTLNRPEKLNALTPATFHELRAHLDAIDADASVRCVVLTGAGRSFCAGNDLDAIAAGEGRDEPMLGPETVDALEQVTPADDRQDPWPLLHRRARAGPGVRLPRRRGVDDVRRHPRAVGHGADLGHVDPPAGASRAGQRQGPDVHRPPHRRRTGGGDRAVDRCVADDELDAAVDTLAARDRRQLPAAPTGSSSASCASGWTAPRHDALQWERSRPHGMPDDMAERLARGRPARR